MAKQQKKQNKRAPESRDKLNQFKVEAAAEVGVDLKAYNGNMTTKQAGQIGGKMVKKMVDKYKKKK